MSLTKKDLNFLFRSLPVPSEKTKQEFIDFLFSSSPGGGKGVFVDGTFFATLTDAKPALTAGKIAYVNPGIYNENDLLTGIDPTANWYFLPGAIVDFDGTIGDPSIAIFDSSFLAAGYQGKILGWGIFNKVTDASFRGVLYTNNVLDTPYLEALNIDSQGNAAIWSDEGTIQYKVKEKIQANGGDCLFTGGASAKIFGTSDILEDNGAPVIANGFNGSVIDVRAREIISTNQRLAQGTNGSIIRLNFDLMKTGDSEAVFGEFDTDIILQGRRIENDSATKGVFKSGKSIIDVIQIENLSGKIIETIDAGSSFEFLQGELLGNINSEIINLDSNSTIRLRNTKVINNNGGIAAHVLGKSNGILILNNVALITAGSGDSITASTPQDVKVYQGVANTAVNANITEQVNNLTIDALVE